MTSSSEHLLNSSTDFQHSNVSVTPVSGGANSTLRHSEVAVDPAAIERWPGWDISAAYDGYRVYSHGAENSVWDIAVLSFYTDAECAPSSKIALLDPATATLISSGYYNNESEYRPISAFDESSTSIWGGRTKGEHFWLGYESGPSEVVKCIKIHQGNSDGDGMQDGFTIQGKQGDGGWIHLYDVEGAATASGISLLPVSATWTCGGFVTFSAGPDNECGSEGQGGTECKSDCCPAQKVSCRSRCSIFDLNPNGCLMTCLDDRGCDFESTGLACGDFGTFLAGHGNQCGGDGQGGTECKSACCPAQKGHCRSRCSFTSNPNGCLMTCLDNRGCDFESAGLTCGDFGTFSAGPGNQCGGPPSSAVSRSWQIIFLSITTSFIMVIW